MAKKPVVLIIRDGWGVNPGGQETAEQDGNSTLLANTPFHDSLLSTYPKGFVSASGMDVGLPDGQMGNSEVGHLNLGAGRIVYQSLTRINKSIDDGEMPNIEALKRAFEKAKGGTLHFMGLVSDGGVHSHQDHLAAFVKAAAEAGVKNISIHAITDGRDTSPTGGVDYLKKLEADIEGTGARIVTVVGRYYAMDRDTRWERNKLAWDAIVLGRGKQFDGKASEALAAEYEAGETDEFIKPIILGDADQQRVDDEDVVFWFNFRADRARQLCNAFLNGEAFVAFDKEVHPKPHFLTLTEYDETYECDVVYPSSSMKNVLGEVVADAGLSQLRIAETEKYPHVTYFFNGGAETPFMDEDRQIVASPAVATYDLQPEMSAPEVTETLVKRLKDYDMVILNFANPDMVGHTGIVEACKKACETIDQGVQAVVEETLNLGGKVLITADHGNCEKLINADGSPHTAHTTNLVHAIYVADDHEAVKVKDGILADVAPTLLDMLGVEKPEEMTGSTLLER
ncbi:2,3-bisphosphoglycerate-independent phosphoglycerate mutase [Rubritalea tangerina]|uniref:2,3-bisphosphoglycerate-independent phosphoglycerate mutase n=1 Tax=Rubritalea tangerina TaxID=430798 RepID=A0ABW4ZBF5_9BACT